MKLTHREKHVLIAAIILAMFFIITSPSSSTVQEWEWFFLLFVVAPLGLYLASDPERKKEE